MAQSADLAVAEWALLPLVNAGRYDAARAAARRSGLDRAAFTLPATTSAMTDEQRALVFGVAVLDAQIDAEGRAAGDPAMARGRFARVRRASAALSETWWAALRGESQALTLMNEPDSQVALAQEIADGTSDPEVAQWALMHLVNAGRYDTARALVRRAGLDTAPSTQPGLVRALSAGERDMVFGLAMLDAQRDPDGRPSGEPAMARGRFMRVRRACDAGSDFWLAALRGELQALDLMDAQDEAATLTAEIEAFHPNLTLPPDILSRIGKG